MFKRNTVFLCLFLFLFSALLFAVDNITVINKTGYDIYYLKISPVDNDDWGEDWLGEEILADGGILSFDLSGRGWEGLCEFDIKAMDEEDDTYIQWGLNLCDRSKVILTMDDYVVPEEEVSSGPETDCGAPQDVTIVNGTGYEIWYVYVSPADADSWGKDRLGDDVVPAGDSFLVCLPGYDETCIFDIRVEDSEGDSYIKLDVDLCALESLEFTLEDLYFE